MESKLISLWELLESYNVTIPIIQRDYAQGRDGKEYVREKFLLQIKNALKEKEEEGSGELDFVYGTTSDKTFFPLDGQQRLTTLWLLHWFIAMKAGKLNDDEVKKRLKKFSYETRTSSREFCEKLCEFTTSSENVSKQIINQTWFYNVWKQDPTIQSMLCMLEGNDKKDKTGHNFIDGIEELFKEEKDWEDLWGKLTNDRPLKFYLLEIGSEKLPITDDLYIKMNARGKQLSDFENFKADLCSKLLEENNNDKQNTDYKRLLDNVWTDYFWNTDEISIFDDKWMAFLCRFFVCIRMEQLLKETNEEIGKKLNAWHVYSDDPEGGFKYKYKGFHDFKEIQILDSLKRLDVLFNGWGVLFKVWNDLFKGWEKIKDVKNLTSSLWGEDFSFIPKKEVVKGKDVVSTLTMKTRVLFYGTMRFCEKLGEKYKALNEDEILKNKDEILKKWENWKRVLWNLAENTNTSSNISEFVGVIKMISMLSENALDIYNNLVENKFNFDQFKEECLKAKRILSCPEWENDIKNAEEFPFFKGAIRFLYTNEKGEVNWDRDTFNTKFSKAKEYFDSDSDRIKEDKQVELIKTFVLLCKNWDNQLYDQQIFSPNKSTWKQILCSNTWHECIHQILTNNELPTESSLESNDQNVKNYLPPTLKEMPYEYIIKNLPEGRFRWNYGRLAFYKPRARDAIVMDWKDFSRNKTLANLKVKSKQKINDTPFFWGWDIKFTYNDSSFLWKYDNHVYLLNEDNLIKKSENSQGTLEDQFYCFNAENRDTESFLEKLKELLNDAPQPQTNEVDGDGV